MVNFLKILAALHSKFTILRRTTTETLKVGIPVTCDLGVSSTATWTLYTLCKLRVALISMAISEKCNFNDCPLEGAMVCGFDEKNTEYRMFITECAFKVYSTCHSIELKKTPAEFCLKQFEINEIFCPEFCPTHYKPVCGISKTRSYMSKLFSNDCYLDMLNCRSGEFNDYVEVPLSYCQGNLMKNISKEMVDQIED